MTVPGITFCFFRALDPSGGNAFARHGASCPSDARTTLLDSTLAQDIMTPHPLTIDPDADVREAAREMLYAEVHRLFVVQHGRLIGVISTSDIVRAVATGKL